ncbi:MAG: hypothetical protein L0J76_05290 [Tetragenococcus halophilus]|nr:hypothetical protein [Tetragenococcus halophilus]
MNKETTLTKFKKRALREIEWFPDEKHVDIQDMLEYGEVIDLTPNNFSGAEDPDNPKSQKEVLRAISIDIQEDKEVRDYLLKYVVKKSKEELISLYTELNSVFVVSEGSYQGVYVKAF